MRRLTWIVVGLAVGVAAWLALWPVPIAPVAWQAPRPRAREGVLAPNERLRGVERLGAPDALRPEATTFDAEGRIVTGLVDGRVVRIDPRTGAVSLVARTGGRPLGVAYDPEGRLYVADAAKGLLRISPSGEVTTLATGEGGVPFGFADDVVVAPDGKVWFTDATARFGEGAYRDDILEHAGTGRLLSYDPSTGEVTRRLSGLQFANGVAVHGSGNWIAVAETGSYRLLRYWIAGPRAGTAEPLVENLPGFPDNVTWSPERGAFWVALWPRVAAVDALAPYPFLRKVVRRLPRAVQPDPATHAWVVAVDPDGRIVESLEWLAPSAYFPVTSVRERDGFLWLGSLEQAGIGRVAAPPINRPTTRP